jgi:hypothetical protein
MALEAIGFVDITTYSPWVKIEDVSKDTYEECVAEGRVVYEDNDVVILALILGKDGESCCSRAVIPKGAITSRRVIENGS